LAIDAGEKPATRHNEITTVNTELNIRFITSKPPCCI
jgi:hypothetical protein